MARARELQPDAIRVILSGFAEVNLVLQAINQGLVYRYFTKPWDDDQLRADFRQCLETFATRAENRALTEQVQSQNLELQRLNASLERLVQERTHSLFLSQELIQKLPCGVFGVSAEGTIVLANRAATKRWPDLAVGFDADEVFEEEFTSALRASFETRLPREVIHRGAHLTLEPVLDEEVLGCVVFFGEECHAT